LRPFAHASSVAALSPSFVALGVELGVAVGVAVAVAVGVGVGVAVVRSVA
jgi:hypothetical protein